MTRVLGKYLFPQAGDEMGLGMAASLVMHLLLVAVLIFWPKGSNRHQIFAPAYNVRLVGPPLGPVAPPPKAKAAAKPAPKPAAEPAPAPKPKPKPKEAIATKEQAKPKPKAKRLKAKKPDEALLAEKELDKRLARLRSQVASQRRVDKAIGRIENRLGAQGQAASGAWASSGSGDTSLRFQIYYTEIWQRIRQHWVLPEALVKNTKGLQTILVMRIRRDGQLEKVWLEKSSGNERFDQSALRAARRASPLPPLPSGLRGGSHEVGVRFRAEDLGG